MSFWWIILGVYWFCVIAAAVWGHYLHKKGELVADYPYGDDGLC
jgi:hypothetical protein